LRAADGKARRSRQQHHVLSCDLRRRSDDRGRVKELARRKEFEISGAFSSEIAATDPALLPKILGDERMPKHPQSYKQIIETEQGTVGGREQKEDW